MDDGAGGEEQKCLEEGVGYDVEDGGRVGADSAGQEHIAELRDGGVGEDALDIVLNQTDAGGEECGGGSDSGDPGERVGGTIEQGVAARDHVDTGGDHRRGVDEGGNGGGAFHRVRQPDVKGDLRGFAGGADE